MTPALLLAVVLAYFALLLVVAWRTSRGAGNEAFFIGNRSSHWALVSFGMIGTSLSGVTFVSVPGAVGATQWTYLQIVIGHLIGYALVAFVLLPLYYGLKLTSIYDYLGRRFGPTSRRTGAGLFIVSRTLGATARLYLVVRILQEHVLDAWGVPFVVTAAVLLAMIVLYTREGGVKTIVWTDTLQTAGMLFGLVACIAFLLSSLQLSPLAAFERMREAGLTEVFATDPLARSFWLKQISAGIFITLAMTGLDQEMMQKNISVRTLAGAQKNMLVMAAVMFGVVLLFLYLGALLHLYAADAGIAERGDRLFPSVVLRHLPALMQLVFVLALISALFPSADGAITALTSSTCIDLLRMSERQDWDEARRERVRRTVHLAFALLFALLLLVFRWIDDPSMIGLILKIAAYTYGPLLGLYAWGILTRRGVPEAAVPAIVLAAPLACALLEWQQRRLFGAYQLGLELLIINGALTFALLAVASTMGVSRYSASSVRR